jgi:hypothetical protein
MKRVYLFLFLCIPTIAFSQLGVSFHQSNLPFIGVNYEFKERFRPELRVGTDQYFEDLTLEAVFTYDIINKDAYEFYAGLGLRTDFEPGLVIPVGLNIYPFTEKKFGFHIELSPILGGSEVLRGSWGIRYRFLKNE